jgi:hypothetical protein
LRRKIIPQLMRKLQKYCINIQVLAIIKEGTQIRIQYIFDYEMSIIEENIELQISEKTLITSKEIVIKLYRILNPNIKGVLDKIKEL